MAGSKCNVEENTYLNGRYGSETPATIDFALYTAAPSDSAAGTECTGTGYARKSVTNDDTTFPDATTGVKSNGIDIDFGTAGAGGWGTVVAGATFEGGTSVMIHWFTFDTPKLVNAGDPVKILANGLTITED